MGERGTRLHRAPREPENGEVWLKLALAQHRLGQFENALEGYRRADELGFQPVRARYNLACTYARLGRKDEAFSWLTKVVEVGFIGPDLLRSDEDLTTLRDDPRFPPLVARAEKMSRPCDAVPRYGMLDFWVGE